MRSVPWWPSKQQALTKTRKMMGRKAKRWRIRLGMMCLTQLKIPLLCSQKHSQRSKKKNFSLWIKSEQKLL